MTLYLAFNAGGFFAGAPAVAACALGIALVLRILIADEPFAGVGPWIAFPAACLGLYGAWILISSGWSDAPARAMIEFDRLLLYLLALLFFGSFAFARRRLEWGVRALAVAIAAIAVAALATRLLPEAFPTEATIESNRLGFPLTYWNGLGLLTAVGLVASLHVCSGTSESRAARALAAAVIPLLVATMYFTFSRGAVVAAALGVVAYLLLARPRGAVPALLAAGPPAAVGAIACYGADLLSTGAYSSPAGADQGQEVALALIACAVVAALLRLAAAAVIDPRLERWRPTAAARRGILATAGGVLLVALIVGIAAGGPGWVADRYDGFVSGEQIEDTGDLRGRLTDVSNNGRLDQWRVALDAFEAEPLRGAGAGTFARVWARDGEGTLKVEDGHSLYLENLAELGLIGFGLLAAALIALLAGLALKLARTPAVAVVLAAGLMWAVHAGVDWDWEMPATGLWLFSLSGLALARESGAPRRLPAPPRILRLALSVAVLVVLVTPTLMALSQRQLNAAVADLKRGDCAGASSAALAAADLVPARPEPFQVLSYCNSRAGEHALAVKMAEAALERDPESWQSAYGLALVTGAAGRDPRPAARRALELSPRSPLTQEAAEAFDTDDPQEWRRRALEARLPIL